MNGPASESSHAASAENKAREMRASEENKRKKRIMFTAGGGVIALAAALVGGAYIYKMTAPVPPPTGPDGQPRNVSAQTGAFSVGESTSVVDVTVYSDYMCPGCKQFEQQFLPTIKKFVDAGDVKLHYVPVSNLDASSRGTKYSTRSAAATMCVANQNPDKALPFAEALFDKQPKKHTKGLSDEELTNIATEVGVTTSINDCLRAKTFNNFVTEYSNTAREVAPSTPTVLVDGTAIPWKTTTWEEKEKIIADAIAAKKK